MLCKAGQHTTEIQHNSAKAVCFQGEIGCLELGGIWIHNTYFLGDASTTKAAQMQSKPIKASFSIWTWTCTVCIDNWAIKYFILTQGHLVGVHLNLLVYVHLHYCSSKRGKVRKKRQEHVSFHVELHQRGSPWLFCQESWDRSWYILQLGGPGFPPTDMLQQMQQLMISHI